MAKLNSSGDSSRKVTFGIKKKRPGIHSKNNTSSHKHSKTYRKKYRGQGK
jgi:hypothetical protein